ncbi:MFS transporter [Vibrio cincinnatiensis]|uniref:MFS transporter n=1 Tax=Vibrio cincinnatiensis TaxID=675 RepID=UPI001EDCDBB8|nr:MFS transporter [Vibrio cincinnatiensis]MCG3729377.1 MFS transporter [Vibrio cincinnatiensis]
MINKKFPIIISIIIGSASAITPPILLTYGMGQFNIIRIVGQDQSTWWFSMTLGIVSLSLIFLNPLAGYIFDKSRLSFISRPLWILISSLFGFISMVSLSYTNNMILLIFFWVTSNISYSLVSLVYFVLIPEIFKKNNLGEISGFTGSLIPIVVMVISITVMGIFSPLSVSNKIILTASIQLILNIAIIYFIDIPSKELSPNPKKDNNRIAKHNIYPSFKYYPDFTWTLLSRLCIHLVSSGLTMMPLFYIARFSLSEEKIFKLQAINSTGVLLMVLFGIISGYLSDKYNTKKPFVIFSSLAMGICMYLYSISDSVLFAIVISFIYQCCFGVFNSVDLALVNHVLPSKDNYAKDIAIMNTTNNIAKSIISFITPTLLIWGITWMDDDGYTLFFIVLALFSFLSFLFVTQVKAK